MSSTNPLTAVARVITTTHNADGKSVFQSDRAVKPVSPFGPDGASLSVFDVRESVPVSNQEEPKELESSLPRCPPEGVNFGVTNFAPGQSAPMHRTLSLDYAVILSGEIVLELDSGEEKTVRAGEFLVQGGTNHMWHNRTDAVCRMAYVMVGSDKVKLKDGQELDETTIRQ